MKKIILTICVLYFCILPFSDDIIQRFNLTDNSIIYGKLIKFEDNHYTIHSNILGIIKINSDYISSVTKLSRNDTKTDNTTKATKSKIDLNKMPDMSQLGKIQNEIIKNMNPQTIESLMNSPAIQSILSDPAIMNAISTGNYTELLNNKEILNLMNDPEIQKLLKQYEQ